MASNSQLLSLIIAAQDKASGVIAGISTKLAGLGNAAGAASVKAGGLSDSIAAGMVKANLAIGMVTGAYQKLTGAIQEASNIELENLNAASGLEAFVGDYDKAVKMVSSISKDLAKAAGPLPGSTGEYVSIFRNLTDDVGNAFKGADGKIANLAEYEKTLKSLSISFGAINATGDKNIGNMQLGLSRLLNGASLKEVFSINSIGNNVRLKTALEDAVKASGKDLQKMTSAERVKLLEKVGSSLVTPEYLARAQNTLDAMWQSFISGLFDSQGGLFGVLRDLDEKMNGDQNAYESIKKTVGLLIGPGGLFEQFGGIMTALGLSVDPMRVLRDGADRLNVLLTELKGMFQGMRLGLEGGANLETVLKVQLKNMKNSIFGFFSRVFAFDVKSFSVVGETLGQNLAATINRGMQWLGTIDWSKAFSQVGQTIGGAINVMVKGLTGFLAGIDWSKVSNLSSGLTQGLIQGILSFLGAIDYGAIAQLAIQVIGSLLIGSMISFGSIVGTGLTTLATTGGPMLLNGIGAGLETLKTFVVGAIGQSAGMFGSMISGLWSQLGNAVGQGVQALGAKIMDLFSAIAAKIGEAILMVRNNPVSQTIGTVASAVTNPIGTAANMIGSVMPKFAGHIPNAANGLVAAANAEAKAMPSGARLVMANDSETIIPRGKALSSGRGGNTFNFNITGDNPDAIANKVMAKIQQAFEVELNAQLA
jgi:hypothetical protein